MQPELLVNRGLLPELADKFQPIFFSRKPAAHRRELCLGERYSSTTTRLTFRQTAFGCGVVRA